jgi:aspartyl-tRNA(Asn)/glutamyl-tRNA(Gln) amidotransferase subunit A
MGSSGENSAYSAARNPWDLERAPGGSSSGSVAAVAAGCAPLALGSDTGGSVRQPAARCGVSAVKPSYGRLSRFGLVAFGSSLDQIGPIARSVRDLELVMEALTGPDERDATCSPEGPFQRSERALEGLRLGVPREYLDAGIDARVRSSVEVALAELEAAGAVRVPLDLPTTEAAVACYYVLAAAEAASNLARFDGVRYGRREPGDGSLAGMQAATRGRGFGAEVKRRILLGTFVLSHGYYDAWYRRAQGVRASIAAELGAAFEHVDLIVGPTCPEPAFRLGEKSDDPLALYRTDALTVPASLAGLPAVSVPVRCAPVGEVELPVGLQLIGPRGGDADVLAAAAAFQRVSTHHRRRPPRESQP